MLDLVKKILSYSKHQRLMRLIELSVKQTTGGDLNPFEDIEIMMIQFIRTENGEIEEVLKSRQWQEEESN